LKNGKVHYLTGLNGRDTRGTKLRGDGAMDTNGKKHRVMTQFENLTFTSRREEESLIAPS